MATTRLSYQAALYASMARSCAGATSSRERLSPALARTLRPGSSTVPAALAVMARTVESSTPMMPWFLAILVVALCAASLRRCARRAWNRTTARRAFCRLRDPVLRRAPRCCNAASRRRSRSVVRGSRTASPVDSTIGLAMPTSMPTAGAKFGRVSATSISHWMDTNHPLASRLTVAVFGTPSSGRCRTHATQPALGRKMRSASILTCLGSG